MPQALINGRIFTGENLLTGRALIIRGSKIEGICRDDDLPSDVSSIIDLGGNILAPGFIDLQVNGGGGALFNDNPDVDTIIRISEAHRHFGTTGFLPTLISDDFSVMKEAILAVSLAISEGIPGVLGVHLEGPFLNPARKGIHNEKKFRYIDEEAFRILTSLAVGKTLVTLAPEQSSPLIIKQLSRAGVLVSAGHSNATYDEIQVAISAGLGGFTHLFNAMSPLQSREPGVVGAALTDPNTWCGVIVDGHHVHPATLKIALAAKPKGKVFLVTDAMPIVGSTQKSFFLNGQRIRSENGRCVNEENVLAGSDLDMATAVRNTVKLGGLDWCEAVRMASTYPAAYLGLDRQVGYLKPGYRANMVLLDDEMRCKQSWIGGQPGELIR